MTHTAGGVSQMRVVLEVDDLDAAIDFYRDRLGLDHIGSYESDGDARVAIFEAGRATLELANPAQTRLIDDVEVGRAIGAKIRIAFQVEDATAGTDALTAAGARLIAPPTRTPWNSLNSRLESVDGTQLTLFQELGDEVWPS